MYWLSFLPRSVNYQVVRNRCPWRVLPHLCKDTAPLSGFGTRILQEDCRDTSVTSTS